MIKLQSLVVPLKGFGGRVACGWIMARILFLINTFNIGGAERQAILLAEQFLHLGHTLQVCAFQEGEQAAALCRGAGLPICVLPLPLSKPRPVKSAIEFLLYLRRFSPDYIFSYCGMPNIFASLAFPFTSAMHCIWGQRDGGLDGPLLKMFPFLNRIPSIFVSNSTAGLEFLNIFAPDGRVFHIQNAVLLAPPKMSRSQWRQKFNIDSDALVFLKIATLSCHKAHNILLESWALAQRNPLFPSSARLVLAGRPTAHAKKLLGMALALGITDSVIFAGNVEDVAGLINSADVGVFSSRFEGLPNSVLECMAGGLPMVALDIEGTREALGNSKENILIFPHTVENFAYGLMEMATDPGKRRAAGTFNKAIIEKNCSPSLLLKKYEEILTLPPVTCCARLARCFFSVFSITSFIIMKMIQKILDKLS